MNKLQSLDLNKTPITISHKNKKHNSSKTGGLCSLFFLLIMLVITFYKMNELLITKNAKLTSYQITESQKLDLYDANIFICIRDFSDPDNWEKFVGFQEQYQYGINVTIVAVDQRRIQGLSRQLVPCNFSQYSYSAQYFCIPQDMHVQVYGRDDRFRQKRKSTASQKLQKYLIRIRPCSQQISYKCKNLSTDLQSNIIFRHSPITYLQNTTNIAFDSQTKQLYSHTFLSHHLMYVHSIYFQLLQIITDKSIIPTALYNDSQVEQGIYSDDDDNKIQVIQREYLEQDEYVIYIVMRGASTTRYLRSYAKVDFVLAEILGMMGMVSFVVFGIYQGYNQWKFQRELLIGQGKCMNSVKPNIFVYYKQKILNLCQRKSNQNQQQQRNEHKLDIYYMMKRIQLLQSKQKYQINICKKCENKLNYSQNQQNPNVTIDYKESSRQNFIQSKNNNRNIEQSFLSNS